MKIIYLMLLVFLLGGCMSTPMHQYYSLKSDVNLEYQQSYLSKPKYGYRRFIQDAGKFQTFLMVAESQIPDLSDVSNEEARKQDIIDAFNRVYKDKCVKTFLSPT